MKKPPAFQFYADDFLGGVSDMTQAEVGAYILLLCAQWSRGEIPTDAARAALIAKGDVSAHVLSKFPGGKNARLELVRADQQAYRELQSQKGRASAQARLNRGSTAVQPEGQPKANPPSPSPSPLSLSPNGEREGEAAAPSAPAAKPAKVEQTDEQWLAELAADAAYAHVSIPTEWAKMHRWCATNRKQPTRRRFINWINRIDRPVAAPGTRSAAESARVASILGYQNGL